LKRVEKILINFIRKRRASFDFYLCNNSLSRGKQDKDSVKEREGGENSPAKFARRDATARARPADF